MNQNIQFREVRSEDVSWLKTQIEESWGSESVILNGKLYNLLTLPGIIAISRSRPIGFLIYTITGKRLEILGLKSIVEKNGVGTALIEEAKKIAVSAACDKARLITTNDNTDALRFYQKRGFVISDVRIDQIKKSRELKPQIPQIGNNGIPIRDEIELTLAL